MRDDESGGRAIPRPTRPSGPDERAERVRSPSGRPSSLPPLGRDEPRGRAWLLGGATAVLAAIAIALVARSLAKLRPPPEVNEAAAPSASATAVVPAVARCTELAEPFVIGDATPDKRPATNDADAEAEEAPTELTPFAVEIGRGVAYAGGFAASVLRDAEGGTVAYVATLDANGRGGKVVRLGRSRGDLDAPVIASAGDALLAAMIEPHASGRTIRIAKIAGENVTWGPELSEGQDESLAVDMAASGGRAVIAWDDLPKGAKTSGVFATTMDLATLKTSAVPHLLSASELDAESPRVIPRPGGFWLAYVVRGEKAEKKKDKPAASAHAQSPKPKSAADDEDTASGGEAIEPAWIAIAMLDDGGAPVGAARAVTPKDGHVLAFDLEAGEDGSALLAWRDDDTPSGSSGGRLGTALVRVSGAIEPRILTEEALASGVPDLLPGWIAVPDVNGATRLGVLTPRGELEGTLDPEPSMRGAEPLAGANDTLLVARPAGKAMKLSVMRCARAASVDAGN